MMKKIFATAALFAFVAAPLAFAQVPGPNTSYDAAQNPHAYGAPGSVEYDIVSVGGGIGVAGASDYNLEDRDGDGEPDFDGDTEYGTGGGFFPAGPWATVCGYNPHHSGDVHVHDAVFQPGDGTGLHEAVSFTVGADPSPPTIVSTPPVTVTNPIDNSEIVILEGGDDCVDDGCICVGDLDPDDWLQSCLHACSISAPADNTNALYGQPGGDGGYFVFTNCNATTDGGWEGALIRLGTTDANGDGIPDDTNGDGVPDASPSVQPITPPTTAGATCTLTGTIFFPA